ncbi:MAG: SpoIIE family protein phosphatase [Candidatus Kapaibacterium sp.]
MNTNRKPLILIVDDVVGNIQIIGNLLIENGYNISVSVNGRQALNTARNIKPDLVLLDIMMPDIGGFEVCKELKKDPDLKNVPVIFLTAKHETKDIVTGFSVGGVDFISKPFQKQEVIARIESQLELKFSRDLLVKRSSEIKQLNDMLNAELSIAAEYFSSLLPESINNENIETYWKYEPTTELGGDAFGIYKIDDKNYMIFLFDVSGHGIAAGMYSVSLINTLKYRNLSDCDFSSPESVFSALNKLYQINEHYGMYFTIWYGVFNTETRELKYAAAGHHPSILSYSNGRTDFLASPNFIIGGLGNYTFKSSSTILEANSDLYIFSDGTFDVKLPDGTIWTIEDMKQFIEARHSRADKELNELHEFVKNLYEFSFQKDDFTILKVRFK